MGVGKTTVASLLAERLGIASRDLDTLIEARESRSVAEIFQADGEPAFRAIERAALKEVLATETDFVLALGGGTVVDDESRAGLLAGGVVVTLQANPSELVRRVGGDHGRPLLQRGEPQAVLAGIISSRRGVYAEAHHIVSTVARSPEDVADYIATALKDVRVLVPLGERSYRIEIGSGVRRRSPERVRHLCKGETLAVIFDTRAEQWAKEVLAAFDPTSHRVVPIACEGGEANKSLDSVATIWDQALEGGLDRDSLILSVAGGVVGDLAGFAASTLLRGVGFAQLPTTLLAMVDSSVGGKTGFNHGSGKNLLGSFHQPKFVLCDTDTLRTLPEAEFVAGLAEVVKSAWLAGPEAVADLEADASALAARDPAATIRAIHMSTSLKARIVSDDELEAGSRALLNLGHTVAHAVEAGSNYAVYRHGEAVALGLVAAFEVAQQISGIPSDHGDRMQRLLSDLGLPTELSDVKVDVSKFLASDKKRRGDAIRFVVPNEPGQTTIERIELDALERILRPLF